jgi:hypothetical protein
LFFFQRIFLSALLLLTLVGCGSEVSNWPVKTFEKEQWSTTADSQRYVFVRDLLEKDKLLGLTKVQVITMLGKPTFEDPDAAYITYVIKADSNLVHILDVRFRNASGNKTVYNVIVRSD